MTPKLNITFDALGTNWWIESSELRSKQQLIVDELDDITRIWSRFEDDTLVGRMAKSAGKYLLGKKDVGLIDWYHQLYIATDGLVTPLIGQTLSDAGYNKDYSLKSKKTIFVPPKWNDVLSLSDNSLTIRRPTMIDVGAAGKGYAVDRVAELLSGEYCVDASGDMMIHGSKLRVGLQDPLDSTKLIGVATIKDESICGSAVTRRTWGQWHHIINPSTSKPVDDVIAVWVIAKRAMHADGLATALFFVPPERLKNLVKFDYCIVRSDGKIQVSDHSKIELFKGVRE